MLVRKVSGNAKVDVVRRGDLVEKVLKFERVGRRDR
jgi:hypothetical protein